jgi:SAM-dependent methyltransferase
VTGAEGGFDAAAESWDRTYDREGTDAHRVRSRLRAAVELIGAGPGSVLDVGGGSGRLLEELAARGWTVHGVDPAPRLVELARARVPHAARLAVASAEELPFADGTFDAAVIIGVLEYTVVGRALDELGRVLRSGGRAVVGVHGCRSPATVWRRAVAAPAGRLVRRGRPVPPPRPAVALDDVLRGLGEAGLVVERIVPVGVQVVLDPLDRLAPALAYRIASRAERSKRLRRVLATQRLVVARKT